MSGGRTGAYVGEEYWQLRRTDLCRFITKLQDHIDPLICRLVRQVRQEDTTARKQMWRHLLFTLICQDSRGTQFANKLSFDKR